MGLVLEIYACIHVCVCPTELKCAFSFHPLTSLAPSFHAHPNKEVEHRVTIT